MNEHRRAITALLPLLAAGLVGCAVPVPGTPSPAAAQPPTAVPALDLAGGGVDPTLERPVGLDTYQQFIFDGMAAGLESAAAQLQRGEDPTLSCVSVLVYAKREGTASMEAAARKATEQCGREIPLAWATQQLDAVEATGDLAQSIGECASAQVALDMVEERFTDPRTSEQQARLNELCS